MQKKKRRPKKELAGAGLRVKKRRVRRAKCGAAHLPLFCFGGVWRF